MGEMADKTVPLFFMNHNNGNAERNKDMEMSKVKRTIGTVT